MEGEGASSEIIRISPNRAGALIAMQSASALLLIAKERYSHRDYSGAVAESRNAMRLSSSALLFSDGVMSANLDATAAYLLERHPGALPVGEWRRLEDAPDSGSTGPIYRMLLSAMGRLKKTGKQEAKEAISAAEAFVASVSAEMSL